MTNQDPFKIIQEATHAIEEAKAQIEYAHTLMAKRHEIEPERVIRSGKSKG